MAFPGLSLIKDKESSGSGSLLFFIVDDNNFFLSLIEEKLRKVLASELGMKDSAYNIRTFSTGEEMLPFLTEVPDLIILDFYLKENNPSAMNGDEVFNRISKTLPKQKVLFVSGQDDSSVVHQLVKMGIRDYIMKDEELGENLSEFITEFIKNH